jgi:hypothetical protein
MKHNSITSPNAPSFAHACPRKRPGVLIALMAAAALSNAPKVEAGLFEQQHVDSLGSLSPLSVTTEGFRTFLTPFDTSLRYQVSMFQHEGPDDPYFFEIYLAIDNRFNLTPPGLFLTYEFSQWQDGYYTRGGEVGVPYSEPTYLEADGQITLTRNDYVRVYGVQVRIDGNVDWDGNGTLSFSGANVSYKSEIIFEQGTSPYPVADSGGSGAALLGIGLLGLGLAPKLSSLGVFGA